MNKTKQHSKCRALVIVCAAIAMCLLGSIRADAQAQWEGVYGGRDCREAGYKGVQPVTGCNGTGGYIAVGASFSSSQNCQTSDIDVVRTLTNGTVNWQNTYDIGNRQQDDSALSVAQVSDGFIVTGVTYQSSTNTDIFIMKINCDGSFAWAKTYGDAGKDYAYDVIIATTGDGSTTHAGDIVVCGYISDPNTGMAHPYILRTTSTGTIVWDKGYIPPVTDTPGGSGWFKSLIEATKRNGQTAGDIVAVGASDQYGNVLQAIAARVDGNNGTITTGGASLQGFADYGGSYVDEFWSVIEHSSTTNGVNNLIFAGNSTSTLVGGGNTSEIYIVNCPGNPCSTPNAQAFYGDGLTGTVWDEAHSVCEVKNSMTPFSAGDLALTGYTTTAYGDPDAFLLGVPVALNAGPIVSKRYGRIGPTENDIGNSIAYLAGTGFLICGQSSSNLDGYCNRDPEDLYLIKTNASGQSGDCSISWSPGQTNATFTPTCSTPTYLSGYKQDDDAWDYWPTWSRILVCSPRPFQNCKGVAPGDDDEGITGASQSEANLRLYPNPIKSGHKLTIDYQPISSNQITVSVSNALGQTMFESTLPNSGAEMTIPIETEGLSPGAYVVRVSDGRKTDIIRIIVAR